MRMTVEDRAARLAALSDPVRLAVVDELALSDLAPVELRHRLGIESNLLSHHLDVLEAAGIIGRSRSSGDGRRRYLRLVPGAFDRLLATPTVGAGEAMFVCTHNSARSQLAVVVWRSLTGHPASSAGTRPTQEVHPGAVAAAARSGLDLSDARPALIDQTALDAASLVVTVCDRAHEQLGERDDWLHWSIPDPVPDATAAAFDAVMVELRQRIRALVGAEAP